MKVLPIFYTAARLHDLEFGSNIGNRTLYNIIQIYHRCLPYELTNKHDQIHCNMLLFLWKIQNI